MNGWIEALRRRYSEPPSTVAPVHRRFYFAAAYGYPWGLVWHFLFTFHGAAPV